MMFVKMRDKWTRTSIPSGLIISFFCSFMLTLFVQKYYGLSATVQTISSTFVFIALFFSIPEIKKAKELSVKIFLENQLMFYQKFSLQNGVY